MPAQVFRSGAGGRVGTLLVGVLATSLLTIPVPAVVRNLAKINDSRVLAVLEAALIVVGLLAVLLIMFVTGPVRIEVDALEVRFVRGRRTRHLWSRQSTEFTSLVVKQSTNGVPSGTRRNLIAFADGRRTEELCTWFTASTFNDLMGELSPVGAKSRESVVQPSQIPDSTSAARTFTLDHRRTVPADAIRRRIVAAIVAVCAIVVIGLMTADWGRDGGVSNGGADDVMGSVARAGTAMLITAMIILPVIAAAVFITRTRVRRAVDRMPNSLTVTTSTLQVDQRAFYFSQLSGIVMTPPGYADSAKVMVVTEHSGTKSTFPLTVVGAAAVNYPTFIHYDEFVHSLGALAPQGMVRFDLR